MYDEVTHDCICGKCGHQWRSRGDKPPAVCASCTSRLWNDTNRTFDCIIARSCGADPSGEDRNQFCILEFIDNPTVTSEDIFFITRPDLNEYLMNKRYPVGSAVLFVGDFEIDSGNKNLIIHKMKLIYCTEPGFNFYTSGVSCLYNIKSFYENQKAMKRYQEEQERKAKEAELKQRELLESQKKILSEEQKMLDMKKQWLAEMEQGKQ